MKAAFIPQVNDEMDTQNFEKFEEVNMLIPDVCILKYISAKDDSYGSW